MRPSESIGQVVRLVEPLAVVTIGEDREAAVLLDPGDAPVAGLAVTQPPLMVEQQAVRAGVSCGRSRPRRHVIADRCVRPRW